MNENTIMVAKINAQLSTFCHKHGRSFPEKGERTVRILRMMIQVARG